MASVKKILELINYDIYRLCGKSLSYERKLISEQLTGKEIKYKKDIPGINLLIEQFIIFCKIEIKGKCQAEVMDEIKLHFQSLNN